MALAVDATSGAATAVGNTTLSWSHTCGASANKLLVCIGLGDGTDTISSVTYNSVACSFVGAADDGVWARSEIWALNSPTTGSAQTILVTASGTVQMYAGGISFVDSATSLGTHTATNNTTANPSVTVADTASGDIVVSICTTDNAVGTTTESGTAVFEFEDAFSDIDINCQRQVASGPNTVCSWTNSGSGDGWAAIGVAVKAASGDASTSLAGSAATGGHGTASPVFSIGL
jgi:hypothetical protein